GVLEEPRDVRDGESRGTCPEGCVEVEVPLGPGGRVVEGVPDPSIEREEVDPLTHGGGCTKLDRLAASAAAPPRLTRGGFSPNLRPGSLHHIYGAAGLLPRGPRSRPARASRAAARRPAAVCRAGRVRAPARRLPPP